MYIYTSSAVAEGATTVAGEGERPPPPSPLLPLFFRVLFRGSLIFLLLFACSTTAPSDPAVVAEVSSEAGDVARSSSISPLRVSSSSSCKRLCTIASDLFLLLWFFGFCFRSFFLPLEAAAAERASSSAVAGGSGGALTGDGERCSCAAPLSPPAAAVAADFFLRRGFRLRGPLFFLGNGSGIDRAEKKAAAPLYWCGLSSQSIIYYVFPPR